LKAPNGIVLAYLAKAKYGGWPTFTKHLHAALREAGMNPIVRTLGARTAQMPHDFGHGLMARRVTLADLKASQVPIIVAAADKLHAGAASELAKAGATIVVHDPAERHLADIPHERVVVIRRSMKARMPNARFIAHPYARSFTHSEDKAETRRTMPAIAHSRIDFDKYTHLILEANDLGAGISIMGAANPMYLHFKIHPKWPDFSPKAFPRERHAGADLCFGASAVVDMSAIKNDGGGTQYSFLEAWDGQAPLVVNTKWTDGFSDDAMKPEVNCLAAKTGADIAACIRRIAEEPGLAERLVAAGEASLLEHAPALIGAQYRELVGA